MSEAFKKSSRMLDKADYGRAFKKGKRYHGKYFQIIVCENSGNFPKLGLAVSRKVSRRAVIRNRIKRQIRETFRLNNDSLQGIDCVVVAKFAAASASKPLLLSSLKSHWRKISDDA